MQYNLSELAKSQGTFRPIVARASDQVALWRIYRQPLSSWATFTSALLAGATYANALATGDAAGVQEEIDNHDTEVNALLAFLNFYAFFASLSQWQAQRWVGEVQRVTKVDVSLFLDQPTPQLNRAQRRAAAAQAGPSVRRTATGLAASRTLTGLDARLATAVAANVSLVKSVSDDTRARIANAVIAGVQQGLPKAKVAAQVNKGLRLSSARAKRIAKQEVNNAVKQLTLFRMEEAGMEFAEWHHSGADHPRIPHLHRNGLVYRLNDPVWRGLLEPNCGCWARPMFAKK